MTGRWLRTRKDRDIVIGITVIAFVVAVCALAFGARLPFTGKPFEIHADVSSALQLRRGSSVRLGGVDVGRVTAIDRHGPRGARLTLRIDERPGAIHADAHLKIKPRLLLGGNDYVDLSPGTPDAQPIRRGAVIAVSRTAVAVPLDPVLDVLDLSTRDALKASLDGLAGGLGRRPPGAMSGAQGLKRAAHELDGALVSVQQVAGAAQGQHLGDLRRAVRSTGDLTSQLARDPAALAALVSNYDRVFAALASHDTELAASIREFAALTTRGPGALTDIDRALPSVRRLAVSLQPALRAAPSSLSHASTMLTQLTRLAGTRELRGLLTDLRPATRALDPAVTRLSDLFGRVQPINACLTNVVLPTLEAKVPDGRFSTGRPVWQDALHMSANLAAFSNTFDGNGTALRAQTSESEIALTTQLPGGTKLYGSGDIVGVAPLPLKSVKDLQFRPDVPCGTQDPPDLGKRRLNSMPTSLRTAGTLRSGRSTTGLLQALLRGDPAAVLRQLDRLVPDARKLVKRTGSHPQPSKSRQPPKKPGQATPGPRLPDLVPGPLKPPVNALGDEVRKLVGGVLGALSGKGGGR